MDVCCNVVAVAVVGIVKIVAAGVGFVGFAIIVSHVELLPKPGSFPSLFLTLPEPPPKKNLQKNKTHGSLTLRS